MPPVRVALTLTALWLAVIGVTLLFPALANGLFDMRLSNWGVASEYGGVMLAVAGMAAVMRGDPARYAPLVPVLGAGMLLNVGVNAAWLLLGHYHLTEALPPIVVNAALGAWLLLARPAE